MSDVYISRALRKDIPKEAVLLTESDVLKMQWTTIKDWKPQSETWPFRYGIPTLIALNALTVYNIAEHYRRRLKLGTYGQLTMVLPNIVIPCSVAAVLHIVQVSNRIILGQECPLCVQTRAAAIQVSMSVVLPLLLTPVSAFYYAAAYGTYDVPPLKPKFFPEIGQLWLNMTRRFRMKLPIAIIANGLLASAISYFEAKSFYNIQSKVLEKEEQFIKTLSERRNLK